MKRREFLELLPAGVAVPGSTPMAAAGESPLPRAHWIDSGLIDAGGSHEPYLFVVRRGGQRLDARKDYERAQSEETVRALKDAGVEVFHTHVYKGFGMAAPHSDDGATAFGVSQVKTYAIAVLEWT